MTIQITTSAAISRFHSLSEKLVSAPNEELNAIAEDRRRLLLAIAAKAEIPIKKGWREKTLKWMNEHS
jgi:hypothetical protein